MTTWSPKISVMFIKITLHSDWWHQWSSKLWLLWLYGFDTSWEKFFPFFPHYSLFSNLSNVCSPLHCRIAYQPQDLPGHLQQFLDQAKWCLCGNVCFRSFVHYLARLDLPRVAGSVTAIDLTGRMHAPAEAFLCSQRCLTKYEKNPYATVWRWNLNP